MSMRLMVKAWEIKVGNSARKNLLLKLCDNANDDGFCWPSRAYLMELCEMSKSSVIAHTKELEKMGLISKTYRKGVKGNSSNMYQILFAGGVKSAPPETTGAPRGAEFTPPPSAESAPLEDSTPPRGVNFAPPSTDLTPPSTNSAPPPGTESAPGTCHSFEPVTEEGEGALLDVPSSNLFTPEKTHVTKFSMAETWQPSESFAQACRFQGVNLGKFSADDQEDLINEFRGYWMTQSIQLNQAGWEHKLIANLKRNQAHKLKTEKQSANMDWDDKSWADDLNEGLI